MSLRSEAEHVPVQSLCVSRGTMSNPIDQAIALFESMKDIVQKLAGPAAEEIGLSFGDSVKVWRLKRQVRLFKRVQEICAEAGIKPQTVKLSFLTA